MGKRNKSPLNIFLEKVATAFNVDSSYFFEKNDGSVGAEYQNPQNKVSLTKNALIFAKENREAILLFLSSDTVHLVCSFFLGEYIFYVLNTKNAIGYLF